MKTITVNLYTFSELSEEAKKKAIEKNYNINVDYDWWDNVYSDAEEIGLKITGFDIGRRNEITGNFTISANEVAQNILNNHGEEGNTYKTAKAFMAEWQPVFNNYMDETHADYESSESEDKLKSMEENFLNNIKEDYHKMLREEYEYLTTDEAVAERLEANQYEFTEDGKRY